jgi:hypothetical protein
VPHVIFIVIVICLTSGTLGNDAASLQRWVNHMTSRLTSALLVEQQQRLVLLSSEEEDRRDVLLLQEEEEVHAFHQVIGWNASEGRLVPSAPLAAGTWDEQVERCSTLWHSELSNLHGADPPVIANLRELLHSCRAEFGMLVAVCTSDDRAPTDAALDHWNITDLIDVSTQERYCTS